MTENINLPVIRHESGDVREEMSENALENIMPARYQRQDETGDLIEGPEDVFPRVAKNIAVAELVHLPADIWFGEAHVKPEHSDRRALIDEAKRVAAENGIEHSESSGKIKVTERTARFVDYDAIIDDLDTRHADHLREVKQHFEVLMSNLRFIPNTPTIMNAGDELQQLSACFVDSPEDDLSDIYETAREAAEIFQSGGGVGYSFSDIRPYGDRVGSTGGYASGPITFMRSFDQMCETIAQGGTRRGAQMGVMSVSHPDVIQFIHAKNKDVSLANTLRLNDPDDPTYTDFGEALEEARGLIDEDGRVPKHLRNAVEGHLSNFNISVGVTDEFMEALDAGEEFIFENPRTEEPHIATAETKEMYGWFGLAEYVEVGEPLTLPADVLWDRIIDGAYENGEPGVIYLDAMNDDHSFDTEQHPEHEIKATNPCGEQQLENYESCTLGHVNLASLVAEDAPQWDEFYDPSEPGAPQVEAFLDEALRGQELQHRVYWGTRFLDNVVTMSNFPIEEIQQKAEDTRKIGLGIMGLAQLFVQLGVEYGSTAGDEVARQLMTRINHQSKEASSNLAVVRGQFNDWDDSKFAAPTEYPDWFERQTGQDPEEWTGGYPMRNHNTTVIAPTGTTSMLGNTSGGCEPIYNVAYYKNVSDDVQGDEMLVEFDDYFLRVLEANDIDVEAVKAEAEQLMESNDFDGIESLSAVPDAIAELFVTTDDLSGRQHAQIQCALQSGVDAAISKTCNFPNSASKQDMKQVYQYIYDNGGKGVTVYRDGTRSKQVLTTRSDNKSFSDGADDRSDEEFAREVSDALSERFDSWSEFIESSPLEVDVSFVSQSAESSDSVTGKRPRPDTLRSQTYRIETGYGKMYVTVSDGDDGEPFEVFLNIGDSGGFTNSMTEALGKSISTALRSGADPEDLRDDLRGIRSPQVAWHNGQQISSIPDAVGFALDQHARTESVPQPVSDGGETAADASDLTATEDAVPATDERTSDTTADPKEMLNATGSSDGGCPECGNTDVAHIEGCLTCHACGWSKCS